MMKKNDLIAKAKEMIASPTCCEDLKVVTNAWIDSIGKANEHEMAAKLISEVKEDVMPIDGVITFMHSDVAVQHLGADKASAIAKHAEEVKAKGGKFCDCPACSAGLVLLKHEKELLKA